jgi:hypothetical protein
MTSLIATRNLFVNSENTLIGDCRDFTINLPQDLASCNEDENLRITLGSFVMRKSWYSVNKYNNKFYIVGTDGFASPTILSGVVEIPEGNYQSFNDITYGLCPAIKTKVDAVLLATFGITNKSTVSWDFVNNKISISWTVQASGSNSTFDMKIVVFTLKDYNANSPQLLKDIIGTDYISAFQDTQELLGGCNNDDGSVDTFDKLKNCLGLTKTGTAPEFTYSFTGYYVASLNTEEAIYLRTDLNSSAFQTAGFDAGSSLYPYVVNSQILAKIPLNNLPMYYTQAVNNADPPVVQERYLYEKPYDLITYVDNGNNLFSVMLPNKKLNSIRLYLTDSYGRLLPGGLEQIACDAMNFTATLRIDVLG